MATFYLSSTFKDLRDYRQRVDVELRRAGYKVKGMENNTASGAAPLETCLADVAKCDAYIGIFAWRYGSIPEEGNPKGKSITELEYRQAIKCRKETLIFLLREGVSLEPADTDTREIEALRKELSKSHWMREFGDPTELSLEVVTAANSFRRRRFLKRLAKVITGSVVVIVLAVVVWLLAANWKTSVLPPPQPSPQPSPRPIVRLRPWEARFTKTLDDQWQYPKGTWDTEPVEATVADHGALALLVKGREMGIPNDLGGEVFEDFKAVFKIRFKQGTGAAWVLRAQPDGQTGYLFEINKDRATATLFLRGWIYTRNQKGKQFAEAELPFDCCKPTQGLKIVVIVQDYQFDYLIKFEDDDEDDRTLTGHAVTPQFQVGESDFHWRWGTFGLLGTEDGSVMKVENLSIIRLPKND